MYIDGKCLIAERETTTLWFNLAAVEFCDYATWDQ